MPVRSDPWPQGTPCWVDAQVDDPAQAGAFYSALFGWTIEGGGEETGGYLMGTKDGNAVAGIGPKPDPGMLPVWTTYFAADDVDAMAGKADMAGGQLMVSPFDVLDAGRMAIAADTAGGVFGLWQARAHNGAAVYNEHGAYCWNELHTRHLDTAKRFYADLFGYTYTDVGDGTTMRYATFTPPGASDSVGGMNDDTLMPGDPMPTYWLTWFQFDDINSGATRVNELGGTILMPPTDSPVGRMAVVAAPQGEAFGIIDPSAAKGDFPT